MTVSHGVLWAYVIVETALGSGHYLRQRGSGIQKISCTQNMSPSIIVYYVLPLLQTCASKISVHSLTACTQILCPPFPLPPPPAV